MHLVAALEKHTARQENRQEPLSQGCFRATTERALGTGTAGFAYALAKTKRRNKVSSLYIKKIK